MVGWSFPQYLLICRTPLVTKYCYLVQFKISWTIYSISSRGLLDLFCRIRYLNISYLNHEHQTNKLALQTIMFNEKCSMHTSHRHKYLLVWTSKNNHALFLVFLCRKLHDSSWYLWTYRFTVLYNQACKDFDACQWPSDLTNDDEALALYFDKLNDKNHDAIEEVKSSSKQILTFSHFVPRCIVLLLPRPSIFLSFCLTFGFGYAWLNYLLKCN